MRGLKELCQLLQVVVVPLFTEFYFFIYFASSVQRFLIIQDAFALWLLDVPVVCAVSRLYSMTPRVWGYGP
jgi:hypothetical protein